MSDARRYAVWPDPRSRPRSRALQNLNSFHFQNISPPPFTMAAGKWPLILKLQHNIKFDRAGFLIFILAFVSRDSELDQYLSGDLRKICSSDLNEIWCVGRGRWVMHDGMPYGRILGQGQGHEPLKNLNSFHFQNLSPPPFTTGAGKWPLILKLEHNI